MAHGAALMSRKRKKERKRRWREEGASAVQRGDVTQAIEEMVDADLGQTRVDVLGAPPLLPLSSHLHQHVQLLQWHLARHKREAEASKPGGPYGCVQGIGCRRFIFSCMQLNAKEKL